MGNRAFTIGARTVCPASQTCVLPLCLSLSLLSVHCSFRACSSIRKNTEDRLVHLYYVLILKHSQTHHTRPEAEDSLVSGQKGTHSLCWVVDLSPTVNPSSQIKKKKSHTCMQNSTRSNTDCDYRELGCCRPNYLELFLVPFETFVAHSCAFDLRSYS